MKPNPTPPLPSPPPAPPPATPESPANAQTQHATRNTQYALRNRLLESLAVLVGYTLLTLVMTWPLAAQFDRALPAGGDAWQHLWNLWWMKTALVDLGATPFHTPYLYYPNGVDLYFHTLVPLIGAISIPFQLIGLNLLVVYNLMVVLSFVAAGYGTYLLVRDLTGARAPAFVAGIIFAFSPYHFAHLLGQLNLTSLQWIPFYLLALFKMWGLPQLRIADCGLRNGAGDQGPRISGQQSEIKGQGSDDATENPQSAIRNPQSAISTTQSSVLSPQPFAWAAVAGVWLAANAYTEWTYALFLGLFTAWFLVWQVAVARQGPGWWAGPARLAVLGAVAGLLIAPILIPTVREARTATYMQSPPLDTLFYSADLVDAFVPSPFHPWWGSIGGQVMQHFAGRHLAERLVYVGYIPLLLGAAALWLFRRRRSVVFWGWTALGAWVLSLGPVLQWWGRSTFTPFEIRVPLPYLALYYIPFLNIFRAPSRLTVLIMLALAVLVGYLLAALPGLLQRRSPSGARSQGSEADAHATRNTGYPLGDATRNTQHATRNTFHALPCVLVGALVVVEFLSIPYPMAAPGYNVPFYYELAREPGRFGLLELPLRPMSDYEAYQTVHGKPIVGGYLSRQPPDPFVASTPVLRYLLPTTPVDDPLAEEAARTGLADLRRADVRYAVVHWWAFTDEERAALRAKLARVFPTIITRPVPEHQLEIFPLGP